MMTASFRIVSLVPSLTELCFEIGLGPQMAGRTDFCISPPGAVEAVPSMGGPKTVDAAAFRAARPTHVLISPEENARGILPLIAEAGAEAVLVHPLAPEDNRGMFVRFGALFGRETEAAELCRRLDAALAEAARVRAETPEIAVLPLIWKDPWVSVGRATYVAAMLDAVGLAVAPPGDGLYPRIADLPRAAAAADWVLLATEPYLFDEGHAAALRGELGTPHVCLVTGESIAWYGSRVIAALADLAALKRRLLAEESP
ncbi:helical backbone metal receptor [Oleispirillum naphthae]|uniref:ABC transporter substrate-binding protein n=1 Tax=Oleispirillum naphthae TaxID=2838853 RepID=UPI0030825033